MSDHRLIWKFLWTRFEDPTDKRAENSKRMFKRWVPVVIVFIILTTPLSLLGMGTRALIVVVLVAEVLRLRGHFPGLNLWGARTIEMLISCTALGLALLATDNRLVILFPISLGLCYFYLWRKYLRWKSQRAAGGAEGAGEA